MKAEIQKISHGGETHYYNVTIDGLFVGTFKFLTDHKEWCYSSSNGSKTKHQLRAIEAALSNLDGESDEKVRTESQSSEYENKPVKGY